MKSGGFSQAKIRRWCRLLFTPGETPTRWQDSLGNSEYIYIYNFVYSYIYIYPCTSMTFLRKCWLKDYRAFYDYFMIEHILSIDDLWMICRWSMDNFLLKTVVISHWRPCLTSMSDDCLGRGGYSWRWVGTGDGFCFFSPWQHDMFTGKYWKHHLVMTNIAMERSTKFNR